MRVRVRSFLVPPFKEASATIGSVRWRRGILGGDHLRHLPGDSTDTGIDVEVQGGEEPAGVFLEEDLDALGVALVVEERDGLADEAEGSFVHSAVEGDGAVLVDLAAHGDAEVVGKVLGGGTDEGDVVEEALEGAFSRG